MTIHMSQTQSFASPPERVYAALTDIEGWSQWMPNLVRLERLEGEGFGPGTTWREVRKMFGHEAGEVFEVTGATPAQSIDLYVDGSKGTSGRGWYRFHYDLTPQGAGTLVTLRGEIGGMPKLMEWLGGLFAGPFKKAIAKDLIALQKHVDGARAP